jgi:hypothetical protein
MDQPLLVYPKKVPIIKKKNNKSFIHKPDPVILKERITDDNGREIPFVRPNGDRLKSHFVKLRARDPENNEEIR